MTPRRLVSKIHKASSLKRVLTRARGHAKMRVVFTNGCFDLLHKGHVYYLERARRLGDVLVVALNSDASVRRLKGTGRPLNSLSDRMEVMAALESVDFVTWFDEDTPVATIQLLRPDVLVKGGDWKPSQILGGDDVASWGGKVRSLPYVKGRSTTKLIQSARKRR
jgi:rfaE bifunctional protein nucleotidyltransferase chain/domain